MSARPEQYVHVIPKNNNTLWTMEPSDPPKGTEQQILPQNVSVHLSDCHPVKLLTMTHGTFFQRLGKVTDDQHQVFWASGSLGVAEITCYFGRCSGILVNDCCSGQLIHVRHPPTRRLRLRHSLFVFLNHANPYVSRTVLNFKDPQTLSTSTPADSNYTTTLRRETHHG